MIAYYFDPKKPFSTIRFLATFKLPPDFNRIHEEAAIWMLPYFVNGVPVNALRGCMCAENRTTPIITWVRENDAKSRKLLGVYTEVFSHSLRKWATDQATAEYDAVILCCMQPANKTFQQYGKDLVANSCNAADAYDEKNLSDISIKGVDESVRVSIHQYLVQSLLVNLTYIPFQENFHSSIQENTGNDANDIQ